MLPVTHTWDGTEPCVQKKDSKKIKESIHVQPYFCSCIYRTSTFLVVSLHLGIPINASPPTLQVRPRFALRKPFCPSSMSLTFDRYICQYRWKMLVINLSSLARAFYLQSSRCMKYLHQYPYGANTCMCLHRNASPSGEAEVWGEEPLSHRGPNTCLKSTMIDKSTCHLHSA